MHKACMCSSTQNSNPETITQKNRAQIKTLILTTKHAQDIKKTIKLSQKHTHTHTYISINKANKQD